MKHAQILRGLSGAFALGLALCSGSAWAQTPSAGSHPHPHFIAVKGMVQALGSKSFDLYANGTMTSVGFGGGTRVARVVIGSTADLTRGAHVDLQLGSGTTVKSVELEPGPNKWPMRTFPHHGDSHSGKSDAGTGKTGSQKSGTGKHPQPPPQPVHVEGKVLSFNSGSGALTLQVHDGQTATYTVGNSIKVTKIVKGTSNDLANGEMVLVIMSNGMAGFITILSA